MEPEKLEPAPPAALGLSSAAVVMALIVISHLGEFLTRERLPTIAAIPAPYHTSPLIKSVLVMGAMIVLFFAGQPAAVVAIISGALLLLTRRMKAEKIYREIDWPPTCQAPHARGSLRHGLDARRQPHGWSNRCRT
jgi:Na+/H+ antiporter NhaD/arsenite permease-like protein